MFCSIGSGQLPAHVVYEDGDTLAFLDRTPLFHGHTLVIPRAHHETLAELPEELVQPLFVVARRISAAMEDPQGLGAQGSFVAMNNRVSQSVPHLHVHVVPRRRGDGLRGFFWPRTKYSSPAQMAELAQSLRGSISRFG